ncbi:MAG TPA: DUF4440 domain-containing protein [Polyangia bacterium]|nr:DUF4440 domain-containing protein [Polyangia bacterium]
MRPWIVTGLALVLLGVGTARAEDTAATLMRIDKEFSATAEKVGVGRAFSMYAANPTIRFSAPAVKVSPSELAKEFPPDLRLSWSPEEAMAAASGDLGFTWGRWTLHGKNKDGSPREVHGKYVTIWKKQADGTWKFVLDTGQPDPAPVPATPALPAAAPATPLPPAPKP